MKDTRPTSLYGISLPFRFENGRIATSEGPAKVRENLIHLLFTRVGERPMRRGYGAGLRDLVHEPDDLALAARLQAEINRAILEHAPEIDLTGIDIERLDDRIVVDIRYTTDLGPDRVSLPIERR